MHEMVGDEDILSEKEVPWQEHIITITHLMELECPVGGCDPHEARKNPMTLIISEE